MTAPNRSYATFEEWFVNFVGAYDERALRWAFEAGQRAGKPKVKRHPFELSRRALFGRTDVKGK